MWTLIHFHFKDYFFAIFCVVSFCEQKCSYKNIYVPICTFAVLRKKSSQRSSRVMMNSCKKDDFDAKSCNFCILFFDPFGPFLLIIYTVNYIIIQTQITHWFILNYSPLVNIEHANMFGSKQCATLTMLCINIDFLHLVKC